MRVHLGSDHAGLELKDHLMTWLVDHGYEPVRSEEHTSELQSQR